MQLIRDNRIRWESEWNCSACGIVSDDGDWGPAPAELRDQLLIQNGPYCLRLVDNDSVSGGVLKTFRQVYNGSIKDALESANQLRQDGYLGTYVETNLLSVLLRQEGVLSEVHRLSIG
ncbi:hypothetical protein Rhe02_56880 [Rhizocola hellebori]|uniref:Uncharacterized protein n=1 Tax=Rhizocola hellebori TaxID=1392758 RepID=A0A8J3QBP3_9ACTN|nr:hypothetical protein Rhe02_56880 [Rhizocola hellebori]